MRPSDLVARTPGAEVFAVEDTSAQVVWREPTGADVVVDGVVRGRVDPGPRTLEIDGLEPDRTHHVELVGGRRTRSLTVRTLPAPLGPPTARVATISDLHFGSRRFGLWFAPGQSRTTPIEERHPQRCARAAVRAARAWGAELLLIKGDCTEHGRPREWDSLGRFLDEIDIPVLVTPGNHDNRTSPESLGFAEGMARIGRDHVPVQHVDIAGCRVILADSTERGRNPGSLTAVADDVVRLVDGTRGPALVALHHHLHETRLPRLWPLGVFRQDAQRFLAALSEANPDVLVTSGHTHRNRRRRVGPITLTEVGSVKDHPGAWAGYALHEGGIRQVVRRLDELDCFAWTETAGRAVGGVWSRWAPGRLDDRCFTHEWVGTHAADALAAAATTAPSPTVR